MAQAVHRAPINSQATESTPRADRVQIVDEFMVWPQSGLSTPSEKAKGASSAACAFVLLSVPVSINGCDYGAARKGSQVQTRPTPKWLVREPARVVTEFH